VIAVAWLWPAHPAASSKKETVVESKVAPKFEPIETKTPSPASALVTSPPVIPAPAPAVPKTTVRLDLDATAATWVSLVDSEGNRLLAQLMVPGAPRTFELTKDATLVTGNAAGLVLRVNGRPAGSLGYPGQVRQIQIKGGKVVAAATAQ
jgi:hypothetical protein